MFKISTAVAALPAAVLVGLACSSSGPKATSVHDRLARKQSRREDEQHKCSPGAAASPGEHGSGKTRRLMLTFPAAALHGRPPAILVW